MVWKEKKSTKLPFIKSFINITQMNNQNMIEIWNVNQHVLYNDDKLIPAFKN